MKTLERKVRVGFIAGVAALVTLAGLTWNFSRQTLDAANFVAHTHEVIASVGAIESQLHRAEAGQRGYLISGKQRYLDDRDDALAALDKELQRLARFTTNNHSQQLRIVDLKRDISRRIELFQHIVTLRDAKGFATVQAEFSTGPALMNRIRATTGEIAAEEQGLLKERQEAANQRTSAAQAGFVALLAFLAIVLPSLYIRIRNDIRQREQSQTAMKRLTDVLDETPDIVAMADHDGRAIYFNRAARAQLGIEGEAGQVNIKAVYAPWAREKVRDDSVRAAIASGSWHGESAFLSRDGKEIPVSQVLIAHRYPDGSIALSTIARNIAHRKRAEVVLQQAAKYDTSNAQALTLYNAQTNREQVLQGTLDILARNHSFPVSAFYAYEEWGGNLRLAAAHGAPAGIKPLVKLGEGLVGEAAQALRIIHIENPDTAHAELPIETGFGELPSAALLFSPVTYRENLLGVMALASTDKLTERDRNFIELLSTQLGAALYNIKQFEDTKLLAEQLRERSEEITLKNKQVEEGSRMKSDFLANMSHELRTPLNAIIGFSEVIRDGMAGPISAEQKEYVGDILSSGQHLLSLINDILDLSKIESGHMTLSLELVDAATLVASGIAVLKEKAAAHRIALTHEIAPGLDNACLDARKVKQIIYNLLSNAVKFTPDDGAVNISLSRVSRVDIERLQEEPGVRLFALKDQSFEEFLQISVSDTGIGIGAEGLQRLFEPFTQIDSSHSRKYEGTGLGLALIRRLAEVHGGGLMARSAMNKGSCFTVWVPWRDSDAVEQDAPVNAAAVAAIGAETPIMHAEFRATPLMLVVEDEPHAAKLLRAQLEGDGYHVVPASTAEAGLKLAEEMQPDAIVLDIVLPGMDGWEMLTQIKRNPATSEIPVVIVSITDDISKGFALGASQVLTKPVARDELISALASLGFKAAQGERILVADDDPKAVSLVSLHLSAAGFVPVGAYGGREAIELAISKQPVLVVLDLMMPDVSGFDVVQALHAQPHTAHIPIVILTAKMLTPEDRMRLNGKVQRIIEKSDFNPAVLHGEVKRALVKRQHRTL
jgi:PAS domain S-box-containing protein